MIRQLSNSKGFTLLELIVVFSVLTILSVVGIASFVTYSRSQAIAGDANNLVNFINVAKSNASSQVKPTVCSSTSALEGYKLTIVTSGASKDTYNIYVVCSGVSTVVNAAPYVLSPNIDFDTSGSSTTIKTIFFNVLTNAVSITNSSGSSLSSGTIGLTGFGGSVTRSITVSTDGTITTTQ